MKKPTIHERKIACKFINELIDKYGYKISVFNIDEFAKKYDLILLPDYQYYVLNISAKKYYKDDLKRLKQFSKFMKKFEKRDKRK